MNLFNFEIELVSYQLSKNILATVTYYDVMDYPLTSFEIWKYLINQERDHGSVPSSSLSEITEFLREGKRSSRICEQDGFYFLAGREGLVRKRISMEKISVGKLKRMRRLARWLSCIPYVRMLGATGSLAMKNGSRESDWDIFLVLRKGKIWTGRTIVTLFLHLIRKRRHGKKVQDRACLNYFITDDNLEIGTKDLFSAHEYRYFIPLFNLPLFRKFQLANRWIREYQPNFDLLTLPSRWTLREQGVSKKWRWLLETFFNLFDLEQWLSGWQKEKIRRNPKTALEGSLIEANDRALIFLPNPRGPRVFQKFKERLSA